MLAADWLAGVLPRAPRSVAETGLADDLVLKLVAKHLHVGGGLSGAALAARLGVPFAVLEPSLDFMKASGHCAASSAHLGVPALYRYVLTDSGRERAMMFLADNSYVGRLPVPIAAYRAQITQRRRAHGTRITREVVEAAFAHLVLSRHVLDQLGPAIVAGQSLFVYGASGNGKTVIAQAIGNVFGDDIAIPYAIEVDGEIVRVYDAVNHHAIEPVADDELSLESGRDVDGRWVRCRRPVITTGGELTIEDLQLSYSQSGGFYRAPVQVLANGGVLVIDDFGRQQVSPRDLLSRWIVPLENRVDHLTLRSGQKFDVPFETFVIFATNMRPGDLVDEAFLRRIQFKVRAESPSEAEFIEIFANCCRERDLAFDPSLTKRLIAEELRPRRVDLRACQPRDLIERALALGAYASQPRELTPELLRLACDVYFLHNEDVEAN